MRRVLLLGSTGSIGTQALDVIRANPRRFEVVGLSAGVEPRRASRRRPPSSTSSTSPSGRSRPSSLVRDVEADVVLNGITGSVGLGPTLAALEMRAHARPREQGVAHRRRRPRHRDRAARADRAGRLEHSAIAQALRIRRPVGGAPARADRVRRSVPRAAAGGARRRHAGRGARPPDVGHGPRGHDELGDAREQGPRGHRGASAVRCALRRHRGRGAPAVDRALDGRVHRRVDDRPGLAARHAPADLARPGLAAPRGRRRPAAGLDARATSWTFEPLDDGGVPAVGWPSASAAPAARSRRCSTPRTSRRWTRSTRAG